MILRHSELMGDMEGGNRMAIFQMKNALRGLVYEKASYNTHTHILEGPCGELIERDRGIDTRGSIPSAEMDWGSNAAVTHSIRLLGAEDMRREHSVRILRKVENIEGVENERVVNITGKELESIDRAWEVQRGGTSDKTEFLY